MFRYGTFATMLTLTLMVANANARECVGNFSAVNRDDGELLMWYRKARTKEWIFVGRAARGHSVNLKIRGHGHYDILIRRPEDRLLCIPNVDVCAVIEAKS